MRRTYTVEQRKEALELYQTNGPVATSEQLAIPLSTLFSWVSDAGLTGYTDDKQTERYAAKREAVRELLLDRVLDFLQRMSDDYAKARDVQSLATSVAILIDKYRLEMGEATARTYHEGTSDIDRRVSQLVAELERGDSVPVRP